MKITAIKVQINDASRYSIFLDGRYAFSLSDLALLKNQLVLGQELSKDELKKLELVASDDKAYADTLKYLSIRPRSRWEIKTYLKRKGTSLDSAEEIMDRLAAQGLVDDKAFADSWLNNRRTTKLSSFKKLRAELQRKHIDQSIIDQLLGDGQNTERRALAELIKIKAKLPRYKNDKLKLMQYLSRQGFNYGDIKDALNESESEI